MKINLVMIAKNEERCLEGCLRAASGLADGIILVDTGSTDRTKEIAEEFGAVVYEFQWVNDFSAARNFGLERSDGDWNLVLDADEVLRSWDRKGLEETIRRLEGKYPGGWLGAIRRYDVYRSEKKEEMDVSVALLPRLLPRGVRYQGTIHEQPDSTFPCIQIGLEADHDGYLREGKAERNLAYLEEAVKNDPENRYYQYQLAATLRKLGRREESISCFHGFYGKSPSAKDRDTGFWADGVLLYLYTLMDVNTEASLLEAKGIIDQEEPFLGNRPDFCFVCGLYYTKLVLCDVKRYIRYLPEIEKSYLRCLELGEHPEQGGVVGTGSFKAAYNLGVWYEVSGQKEKALEFYRRAEEERYS